MSSSLPKVQIQRITLNSLNGYRSDDDPHIDLKPKSAGDIEVALNIHVDEYSFNDSLINLRLLVVESRNRNVSEFLVSSGRVSELATKNKATGVQIQVIPLENSKRDYRVSFQTNYDKHLSYIATVMADPAETDIAVNSQIAFDVVVENSEPVLSIDAFFDEGETRYTEAVHLLGEQWRSGETETEESTNLTRLPVSNTKLHDYRIVDNILSKTLDFSTSKDHSALFSDIFWTKNRNNDSSFIFGVDFGLMIQNNAMLGSLWKGQQFNKDILTSLSKISKLTIVRRRVDLEMAQKTLLVVSGNGTGKIKKDSDFYSIEEVDLGFQGKRFFSFVDREINAQVGRYQYGVVVEFEDNTREYIVKLIDRLKSNLASLMNYATTASRVGFESYLEYYSDPHIDHVSEKSAVFRKLLGHYNAKTDGFTERFSRAMERRWRTNLSNTPWMRSVRELVAVVGLFWPDTDYGKAISMLSAMTNPVSGTHTGIQRLLKIYDGLLTKLQSSMDNSQFQSVTNETPPSVLAYSGLKQNSSFEHWFASEIENIDVTGFDFVRGEKVSGSESSFPVVEREILDVSSVLNPREIILGSSDAEVFDTSKVVDWFDIERKIHTEDTKGARKYDVSLNTGFGKKIVEVRDPEQEFYAECASSRELAGEEEKEFDRNMWPIFDNIETPKEMEGEPDIDKISEFKLNSGQQVITQTLGGFDLGIKTPIWSEYTQEAFNGRIVLCRLESTRQFKDVRLPIYNKYFLVDLR